MIAWKTTGDRHDTKMQMLLAVIAMREKRPWDAESLLAGLATEYPGNPLIREELARARKMANPVIAGPGTKK